MSLHKAREHIAKHHNGADGWVTLIRKENGQLAEQQHYRPDELSAILSKWIGEDVYFSQNTFYRPQRRVEDVRQLRAVYVDVDHYLLNLAPDWVIGNMEARLFGQAVPDPNLIIHSGRGFVVVWFLEPVPGKKALPLWQAVEKHFASHFRELGGDTKATDAARVFRIAGSTNSKNGAEVVVQYRHDYRYELRQLQTDYLPDLEPKRQRKGRPSRIAHLYNIHRLYHARLCDLSKLVELRGGNMIGYRETVCFLYRYWSCCYIEDESEALRVTLELNNEFSFPLSRREVEKATKSAEKAYWARSDAKANEMAKSLGYPGAGYNLSNEKLIDWLGITEQEQLELQTIIGKPEKRRRDREATSATRRAAGVVPRGQYLAKQGEITADKLKALQEVLAANPNATQRELAKLIGVSVARINMLKKLV